VVVPGFVRYGRIPNMTGPSSPLSPDVGSVTVRYWAAARAAAGVESDAFPVTGNATLAQVLGSVRSRHADRPRLSEVVSVCSVLIGDRPAGSADPNDVQVHAGDVVELLPPFAGG
jgi:sulfur-carrier protein